MGDLYESSGNEDNYNSEFDSNSSGSNSSNSKNSDEEVNFILFKLLVE